MKFIYKKKIRNLVLNCATREHFNSRFGLQPKEHNIPEKMHVMSSNIVKYFIAVFSKASAMCLKFKLWIDFFIGCLCVFPFCPNCPLLQQELLTLCAITVRSTYATQLNLMLVISKVSDFRGYPGPRSPVCICFVAQLVFAQLSSSSRAVLVFEPESSFFAVRPIQQRFFTADHAGLNIIHVHCTNQN